MMPAIPVESPAPRGPALAPEERSTRAPERLLDKLLIMISGTAGTVVLLLLQSVIVARLLGPTDLGQYAPLMAWILLIAQLNDFGLTTAFAYHARHRPGVLPSLLRILVVHMLPCMAIGIVIVVLGSAFAIPGLQGTGSSWWFGTAVVCAITIGTPSVVLPVLLLAMGAYRAYTWFVNGASVLYILAVILISFAIGPSWRGFVVASAIVQLLIAVLEVRYLLRRAGGPIETISARECYRYGLQVKWAEVMKLLSGRLDLLVVAAVLPPSQVGQYSLALSFREAGMIPFRTYGAILQNLLVDRQKGGRDDKDVVLATLVMQTAFSLGIWTVVPIAFGLIVPILYGRDYVEAVGPAAVLFGSTVFLSVAGICFIAFNMWGRPALSARVMTVSGLTGPPVVWLLSRRMGLLGAASGAVVGAALTAFLALVVLSRVRRYRREDLQRVVVHLPMLLRGLIAGMRSLRGDAAGRQVRLEP